MRAKTREDERARCWRTLCVAGVAWVLACSSPSATPDASMGDGRDDPEGESPSDASHRDVAATTDVEDAPVGDGADDATTALAPPPDADTGESGASTAEGSTGAAGAGGTTGAAGSASRRDAGADGAAGTTGAAGDGGARGTAGATSSGGAGAAAGTPAPPGGESVLTRNKRETRDGFFTQPALTRAAAARMAADAGFVAAFPGKTLGSPLYAEDGPAHRGAFVVATTSNDVFALDETTGAVVWRRNVGLAPGQPGVPCGTVHPAGITSTPVIDAASRTIFVAGAVAAAAGGDIARHEIHALSLDDGAERAGWPVDVSNMRSPEGVAFSAPAQNQRGALSLVNGVLYVPYGGHGGDCGTYHGWVFAVNTRAPTQTGAWATAGVGEGIWAAGGMASDGNGVLAATGNRLVDGATHQDSEELVRLTGLGALDRATGVYFPGAWRAMDRADDDLGSSSPVVLTLPGSTPATLVAVASKAGHVFLLNAAHLGGMGGHLQDVFLGAGAAVYGALAAYTSASGVHVAFNAVMSPTCTGIASLAVDPGSPPRLRDAWCVPSAGRSSPIATSPDGRNDTVVWFMNGPVLTAVDGDTGAPIFSGGSCTGLAPWSSPIAAKGRIITGGDGHLCSWSPP